MERINYQRKQTKTNKKRISKQTKSIKVTLHCANFLNKFFFKQFDKKSVNFTSTDEDSPPAHMLWFIFLLLPIKQSLFFILWPDWHRGSKLTQFPKKFQGPQMGFKHETMQSLVSMPDPLHLEVKNLWCFFYNIFTTKNIDFCPYHHCTFYCASLFSKLIA